VHRRVNHRSVVHSTEALLLARLHDIALVFTKSMENFGCVVGSPAFLGFAGEYFLCKD
jgi:hypothetical protein